MSKTLRGLLAALTLAGACLTVAPQVTQADDDDGYWKSYWGWHNNTYRPYYHRHHHRGYYDRNDWDNRYYQRNFRGDQRGYYNRGNAVQVGPFGIYWR